jgi:hypothetical protein
VVKITSSKSKSLHRVIEWVDCSPFVAVGMWATRLRCLHVRSGASRMDMIDRGGCFAAFLIATRMTDEGARQSCGATITLAACR